VDYHVLGVSPLLKLVNPFNLICQVVIETMHLVDGGVIKSFLEYLLYSGTAKHDSRMAKLKQHRLPTTDFNNINSVLAVYKTIAIDDFHRKFR
jgi:hypothetical protein